jgi:hypothetical protein
MGLEIPGTLMGLTVNKLQKTFGSLENSADKGEEQRSTFEVHKYAQPNNFSVWPSKSQGVWSWRIEISF